MGVGGLSDHLVSHFRTLSPKTYDRDDEDVVMLMDGYRLRAKSNPARSSTNRVTTWSGGGEQKCIISFMSD